MRKTRVGVGAALALGALGLSVPIAFGAVAADDSDIHIDPGSGSPGSTVTVTVTGCGEDVTYGKGQSEVAGMFHLFEGDEEGELTGEFEIPVEAEADNDTVTAKCPPATMVTDSYRIGGEDDDEYDEYDDRSANRSKGKDEDSSEDDYGKSKDDDHDKGNHGKGDDDDSDRPNGSVDAGGGGMADQGTQLNLSSSVLVAGAAAAWLVRLRRHSSDAHS